MFEYKITLTDAQQKVLEHDLVDIKDWIDKAVQGKINSCVKRAASECRQILKMDESALVPANDTVAAFALFSAKQYKNRKQREAEVASKKQTTESTTVDTGHTEVLNSDEANESK